MAAEPTGPPEVEIIEVGVERLDDIGALWRAMHDNDSEVVGEAREVTPLRSSQSSWRRRRVEFESWIRAGEGHLLIAEHDGSPAGFAFYRICRGDLSFETDERMGELCGRYGLDMDPDSVPGLVERFDLRFPGEPIG